MISTTFNNVLCNVVVAMNGGNLNIRHDASHWQPLSQMHVYNKRKLTDIYFRSIQYTTLGVYNTLL